MPDDTLMYPHDGESYTGGDYYPDAPEGQQERLAEETGITATSLPIMPAVYEWFSEQMAVCDRISNLDIDNPSVPVQSQVMAWQLLRTLLETKRSEWEAFKPEEES